MNDMTFLQTEILGNRIYDYLFALLLFLAGVIILRVWEKIIFWRIRAFFEKRSVKIEGFFGDLFQKGVIPLLYLAAFYFAVKQLILNQATTQLVNTFCIVVLTFQTTRFVLSLLIYGLEKTWFRKETASGGTPVSKSILTVIRFVVWALGAVFVLDNLGFNISAVIAGLGIGGIAVALAAQTILGDLFNYFVIFFDRPFQEGDAVVVGDFSGTIEHIGIKTTRIRADSGEQIVCHNTDLTSSRIRNYKRMDKRRVKFKLGVTYETSLDQLKKIPVLIKGIIEKIEETGFDRAHFKSFEDSSLEIEVVYYVIGSDYNKYMDVHQQINLAIKEAFEREKIEFAYPTQTIYARQMEMKA